MTARSYEEIKPWHGVYTASDGSRWSLEVAPYDGWLGASENYEWAPDLPNMPVFHGATKELVFAAIEEHIDENRADDLGDMPDDDRGPCYVCGSQTHSATICSWEI